MKYVLMSGSYKEIVIPNEVIDFIESYFNNKKNITFISASFDHYDENDHYVDKLIKSFDKKKLHFDKVDIIDNRMTSNDMIESIKKSNIIFILGGDTLAQIKNINKYNLKKYINDESKIIIGMSAGAINMAKRVVLAKDVEDNIPDLSIYEGIGITDINIEPHCDFKNSNHWKELEKASSYSEIIVMNEDCYIIADNNKMSFYGAYLKLKNSQIIYNGKKSTLINFIKDIEYD